jgi:type IV secretory pathway VirB9-like protein
VQAIKQQRAQAQAAQQQAAQAQQAQQTLAQNYNKLNEAHRPGSPAEAIFKQGGGQ